MKIHTKIATLILSCDKYSDLWTGFLSQFYKYYNLDNPIYFSTNNLIPKNISQDIKIITAGNELSWADNFLKVLEKIEDEYILIMLEDLYLSSPIQGGLLHEIECLIDGMNVVNHIKCSGFITGQESVTNHIKLLDGNTPYRVTLCGLWRKKFLIELINLKETPWEFEIKGSQRSFNSDGFYALDLPLFNYVNMVEKGLWIRKSVKWAKKNQVPIDFNLRKHKSIYGELISVMRDSFFIVMLRVPLKYRTNTVNFFKRVLIVN